MTTATATKPKAGEPQGRKVKTTTTKGRQQVKSEQAMVRKVSPRRVKPKANENEPFTLYLDRAIACMHTDPESWSGIRTPKPRGTD